MTYAKPDASDTPFASSIPLLRATNIVRRGFDLSDLVHVPRQLVAERQTIKQGDVVVATSSGSVSVVGKGAQARTNMDLAFGAFCGVLRPTQHVDERFFGHYFSSEQYRAIVSEMARGVNINNLKRDHFASLVFPLPPRREQARIADKLDAVLALVDACGERLDRVPATLNRFRQAVLAAATSGGLTREWRAKHRRAGIDWQQSTVGQLIQRVEAGLNVQCEERPPSAQERGLVKISAVSWGTYDDDESKTLPAKANVSERSRIRVGDFLLSRANTLELVGACVIAEKVTRPVYLSDKVLRLVMAEDLKAWMLLILRSPRGRSEIEQRATGNQLSMRNLSQANLRDIPIPVPSPDERVEIVRRAQLLLGYADQLERRYDSACRLLDRLTPSVLSKAFRGELVSQDPSDEPASALLARLRAEREEAPRPLRGRKTTRA